MFGSLNYGQANINCESTSTIGTSASAGLTPAGPSGSQQNPSETTAAPQLVTASLYDGGGGNCYQPHLPSSYGAGALQFLQQQTIQQMYNSSQQVYNMGQPSGGQVQLQVNAQATSILQSQSQHHQVPPVQAANILEASDNFLLDNTATSAIAVQTAGANVAEFGIESGVLKQGPSLTKDKSSKTSRTLLLCHICGREVKNKNLLKKHILTMHNGHSSKQATGCGGQRSALSHSGSLWCMETRCDYQTDNCATLAVHIEECHGQHLEKINLQMSSLREFFDWKNHLEETNRVKFTLTSGTIVRARPDTAHFVFECHRTAILRHHSGRERPDQQQDDFDVMQKAVQEILPAGEKSQLHQDEELHRMECLDEHFEKLRHCEENCGKKNRGRSSSSSTAIAGIPCCAHIDVRLSLINGAVAAVGCVSHTGHNPEEKLTPPPSCILGKLKGMLVAGRSKDELCAELPSWTKHRLSEGDWRTLESMSSSTGNTLFPHVHALTKNIFEHLSKITRLVSDHYWVDFMETLADLLEVERRMKVVRETMEAKLKEVSIKEQSRPEQLTTLETELCYALLSHATDRHQLRKFLKYGLDCVADARFSDHRYQADFSMAVRTCVYNPSVLLFKYCSESPAGENLLSDVSSTQHDQRKVTTGTTSVKCKKKRYRRDLIGSDDDSEYDYWSDDQLADIIPRRWPPPSCPSEEKRLEKNLRRKKVPVINLDPILKERMLALRTMALKQADSKRRKSDTEEPTMSSVKRVKKGTGELKNTKETKKDKQPRREAAAKIKLKSRRSLLRGKRVKGEAISNGKRIKRKQGDVHVDATHETNRSIPPLAHVEERPPTEETEPPSEPFVIQEMKMDGPAGKKPRIVKILATQPGQTVDQATIVVEAPPPTPQSAETERQENVDKGTSSVSLLRPGTSLLKGGRSLLKQTSTVSLLKPRELPDPANDRGSIKVKSVMSWVASNNEHHFNGEIREGFDDGSLQTPQPPRIVDE